MNDTPKEISRRGALVGGLVGAAAIPLLGLGSIAQAAGLPEAFGPLHHVGVAIAPNFDEVLAKLTATIGLEFYQPVVETLTLRDENGQVHTYTDRFTLSKGPEPHVELLDPVPGSFFGANPAHPVVELGYVVGDRLAELSAMLIANGMPRLGTIAVDPQPGAVGVAWHQVSNNFLIELLAEDPVVSMV